MAVLCSNGYGLFTQELMPYVLNLPNNERMQEISRRWKVLTQTQRDNYNTRAEKVGLFVS